MIVIFRIFMVFQFLISGESALAFDGLAILGDSSSTGAAAHPKLEFDSKVLWDIFNSVDELPVDVTLYPAEFRSAVAALQSPTRVPPSVRENDGGSGWIWHNLTQKISARTLEEHRLSYGYLIGRKLGLPASDILIAGENGTTARHAWIHAARLVGARQRDLPSRVIFYYTGNDLCAQSYDDISEAEEYGEELLRGMKYLVLNGHADAKGTRIFIPGFLPVTSLLHERSILERKLKLHGEEITCQEARARMFAPNPNSRPTDTDPRFQIFSAFIPPSPVLLCPTLFSKAAEDSARQSFLANRIRAFREAQKSAVSEFNQWRGAKYPAKSFEAFYIETTEQLKFDGADVAGDCFHLSITGQAKVATAILRGVK